MYSLWINESFVMGLLN